MKTNRLGYFISEGVKSIFNRGFMSFASVCTIIACLIIMGSFLLVAVNIESLLSDIEDQSEILAFVDESYTAEEAEALEKDLLAVKNVAGVKFISRKTAMDSFIEKHGENDLYAELDISVFRDRYAVYLDNIAQMEQTQKDLVEVPGIVKVNAYLEISQGLVTVRNVVLIVSLTLIVILVFISLFIMSNTIKLTTFDRREEIAIMKMVGATNSFIRWPFIIQGLILGIFGSFAAFLIQWGIYTLVTEKIVQSYVSSLLPVVPFAAVMIPLLAGFSAVGLLVGIAGSLVAINHYMKV